MDIPTVNINLRLIQQLQSWMPPFLSLEFPELNRADIGVKCSKTCFLWEVEWLSPIKQTWYRRKKGSNSCLLLPRGVLTQRHNSSQLEWNYIGDLGLPYIIDTLTALPSDTEIYICQQKEKPVRVSLCPTNKMSVSEENHIQMLKHKTGG